MTDIKEDLRLATPPEDPEDEVDGSPEPQPADTERIPVPLWKKAVAVGAWIVAAFALTVAFGNLRGDPAPEAVAAGTVLTSIPVAVEAPPDTLEIRFDDVRERWNSIEHAPLIAQQLRRIPESGELDTFRHGFDASAELIGAYRDSDDYLVALVARASLDHPNVSNIYLHMCHVINPYSPECIDNYFTTGLSGQPLEELTTGHSTSWTYDGSEWRVSIEGKLLTIRVLAPDSN